MAPLPLIHTGSAWLQEGALRGHSHFLTSVGSGKQNGACDARQRGDVTEKQACVRNGNQRGFQLMN